MPGLLRRVTRTAVIAGTATAVSGRVSRRQSGRWAQQDQQQQQQQQDQAQAQPAAASSPSEVMPPPMPPDDEMGNKIDKLKKLGELKAQGILTEEEFAAEKQKILG
ncbi:SHOCT domain-containing protein [Streptomyces formicae]|uniref:SHOCT domain-containing protein n=1 Tax=Streptomyces formicae TaxID=1616117 RepID=A0ABY3WI07_9ACTN|nr:SHOCT domain-containing protein [Streptomyces formicae]UNM12226.1 SHOCT domain-containing protein [Streptomyces formicae]